MTLTHPNPSLSHRPMRRVAVVGGGISGLVAARALHRDCEVRVFEAAPDIGGHTHTVSVDDPAGPQRVDMGFIVYNDRTYPNFCRLLDELGVATETSCMSFSVRSERTGFEWNGHPALPRPRPGRGVAGAGVFTPRGARSAERRGDALHWGLDKEFHVSPFLPREQRYAWTFTPPGERLFVHMENRPNAKSGSLDRSDTEVFERDDMTLDEASLAKLDRLAQARPGGHRPALCPHASGVAHAVIRSHRRNL